MPTVIQKDGFAFRIYPNDHPPPHVHVYKAGTWTKIRIETPERATLVMGTGTMSASDTTRALWIIRHSSELLLAHWRRIHEQASIPD
jgi:hypothetical protein